MLKEACCWLAGSETLLSKSKSMLNQSSDAILWYIPVLGISSSATDTLVNGLHVNGQSAAGVCSEPAAVCNLKRRTRLSAAPEAVVWQNSKVSKSCRTECM